MIQAALLRHYSMAQMKLFLSRCKKNIYESKQDNWHPVAIRRFAATDHADCFAFAFVWKHE
jgi:hypothetical protein